MDSLKKRNDLIAGVSAIAAFIVTYGLCIWLGYIEIINGLFTSTGENIGEVFETPIAYVLICLLFFAVMYALVILGIKLKNKIMVILPLLYEIVLVVSIVLLGIYATGGIENETLFGIVEWVLVFAIAPIYGSLWSLPTVFVIIMALVLIILNIYGLVKVFKKDKNDKKIAKK